jgi:hypothetical protein
MAGQQSDILEGWAVQVALPPGLAALLPPALQNADHTYVTSQSGLKWGCFGRSAGGNCLVRGPGDSVIADCLSKPIRPFRVFPLQIPLYAGVIYGITGVCHQAANRVLWPSGNMVVGAAGYQQSAGAFGPYGLFRWLEWPACVPAGTVFAMSNTQNRQGGDMSRPDVYSRVVSNSYAAVQDEAKSRVSDLAALVEMGIGHPLDPATFNELALIQEDLRKAQYDLIQRLQGGTMSPEGYLDLFNEELKKWASRSLALLGEERFEAIFGKEGHHPETLVDRRIFLGEVPIEP